MVSQWRSRACYSRFPSRGYTQCSVKELEPFLHKGFILREGLADSIQDGMARFLHASRFLVIGLGVKGCET